MIQKFKIAFIALAVYAMGPNLCGAEATKIEKIAKIEKIVKRRVANTSIKVALTVDDLPAHSDLPEGVTTSDVARKMLAVLKAEGIPEVYGFINAGKVDDVPEDIKVLELWREAGYPLANHTYSHPRLEKMSAKAFIGDIDKNVPMLQKLNGSADWKYFRYPFLQEGETRAKRNTIRDHLAKEGYKIAQVTIDFDDWAWNEPYARCKDRKNKKALRWLEETYLGNSVEQLRRSDAIATALFNRPISHILLLHIGSFDAEMIEKLVRAYKEAGVEFIPLSQAVQDEVYKIDPGFTMIRGMDGGDEFTFQVLRSRHQKLADLGLNYQNIYPEKKLDRLCR